MLWTVLTDILLVIFVLDCVFMGLVIMMQRSKQEGLGAAFGGGMMEGAFGAQTSTVLVKATVWAATIFFVLSLCLARLYTHSTTQTINQGSSIQQQLLAPLPAATNATANPAAPVPMTGTATTPAASVPTTAPVAPPAAPVKVTTPPAPATPAGK